MSGGVATEDDVTRRLRLTASPRLLVAAKNADVDADADRAVRDVVMVVLVMLGTNCAVLGDDLREKDADISSAGGAPLSEPEKSDTARLARRAATFFALAMMERKDVDMLVAAVLMAAVVVAAVVVAAAAAVLDDDVRPADQVEDGNVDGDDDGGW